MSQQSDPVTSDDILDVLNASDDSDEDPASEDTLLADDKETEEEVKIEEEPKEEGTEELKLEEKEETKVDEFDQVIHRINRQQLLKDYPGLDKKHPQLLNAYYGNQEYRKIFPTLDSVKEAKTRLDAFDSVEGDLAKGSSKSLFSGLKEKSPESFNLVVDNYLGNLKEVDQDAFYHVVGNMTKQTIMAMAHHADLNKASENPDTKQYASDLLTAAKLLNNFMFGEEKFTTPTSFAKRVPEVDVEKDKLEKERKAFNDEKLSSHRTELVSKVDSVIENTIIKNIDPKDSMSPYVKKNAIKEALQTTKELIEKDSEFQSLLSNAWKEAEKNNFSGESKQKIEKALKSKAQVILSDVIKKIRNEALQGASGVKREDKSRTGLLPKRGSNTTPKEGVKTNDTKDPFKGMTSLDFLNRAG